MTPPETTTFFGLLSVQAVIAARLRPLKCLYVRSDSSVRGLARLVHDAKAAGIPVQTSSPDQLARQFGQDIPDVALEAGPRAFLAPQELLRKLRSAPDPWLLALEGIEDPHQLGAVFRTAAATGVTAILLPMRLSQLNPDLVARSSAGTSESATTCVADQINSTLSLLAQENFRILAASAEAAESIYDVSLCGKIGLVLGGRRRGLSAQTLSVCTGSISLPMEGSVASLTVASCAGALLYEAYRQRRNLSSQR